MYNRKEKADWVLNTAIVIVLAVLLIGMAISANQPHSLDDGHGHHPSEFHDPHIEEHSTHDEHFPCTEDEYLRTDGSCIHHDRIIWEELDAGKIDRHCINNPNDCY